MLALRSLQRRHEGVELWAIIPRQADADRTYMVRNLGRPQADAQYGHRASAEAEFDRRVRARGAGDRHRWPLAR